MITVEMINKIKCSYMNWNTPDLLKKISNEVDRYLKNEEFSQDEMLDHFIAAFEMIDRIEILHKHTDDYGVEQCVGSGYTMTHLDEAVERLKDKDLPDGEVVAIAMLGRYHAARKQPEVKWY